MSKFRYLEFSGKDEFLRRVFAKEFTKETPYIKKIKSLNYSKFHIALNIMGELGYELISVPQIGKNLLVFKKKI